MDFLELIRALVGFTLVLFVPGYALTWALFTGRDELDAVERMALSIGLSICVVVIVIYFMNVLLGVKVNLPNSLAAILLVTGVSIAAGKYRRDKETTKQDSAAKN